MISADLAAAHISANTGPCPHDDAVPVESCVTGETLAWLCPPPCGQSLPAEWGDVLARRQAEREFRAACTHEDVLNITRLGDRLRRGMCRRCGQDMTETPDGAWKKSTL